MTAAFARRPRRLAAMVAAQETLNASYYCAGAVGRHAFKYSSTSEDDGNRSIASQVALLSI